MSSRLLDAGRPRMFRGLSSCTFGVLARSQTTRAITKSENQSWIHVASDYEYYGIMEARPTSYRVSALLPAARHLAGDLAYVRKSASEIGECCSIARDSHPLRGSERHMIEGRFIPDSRRRWRLVPAEDLVSDSSRRCC